MEDLATAEARFRRELGARLKAARNAAGISLRTAAARLEMSHQAIGHWETGTNPIDVSKLFALARMYETSVVALMADEISGTDLAAMVNAKLTAQPKPASGKRQDAA